MLVNLENTYNRLLTGDCRVSTYEKEFMVETTTRIISKAFINTCEVNDVINIIKISNLLYNNAPNIRLPLDDDLYDRLLVICRKQGVVYPVGAPPVTFTNLDSGSKLEMHETGKKQVIAVVKNKDEMLYFDKLVKNSTPLIPEDFEVQHDDTLIERKTRNISHTYDMCGTLDKCKYVLNVDAQKNGEFNEPSVMIFERDFIGRHIQQGFVSPQDIHVFVSLKYDGVSVEEEVAGPNIEFACTRGDVGNNEASDLTPVFKGTKFPRAKDIDPNERFGIKFEYIITHQNLARLASDFGKRYVNPRNAVIGLLGGLDARKYKDYLTPIPLESSLDIPRGSELEFLNKYYTKGIDMRFIEVRADYVKAMYIIKKFVDEADSLRTFMPFQYDGVVVEYADPKLRAFLGKKDSVPRYATAIKFNPLKRKSIFTHYTYSVGQDGTIVPMAHFEPVEFYGAIHNKTTVHSLARFRKLALKAGDRVNLSLNNDVIVYITKAPEEEQDKNNPNPYEEFPTKCPSCGHQLMESDSGDSALCVNFYCPERCIARLSNMLKKLNIKDFSSETIRALGAKSLHDLLYYDINYLISRLGNVNGQKFMDRMIELRECGYPDYRLMGAIGFTSIANETWRIILEQLPLEKIVNGTEQDINSIGAIKGIGPKTVKTIKEERHLLMSDLREILNGIKYTPTTQDSINPKIQVRFSGVRDDKLTKLFNDKGFDAREGSVTKTTGILIVPHIGYESGNTKKAFKILGDKYAKLTGIGGTAYIDYNNLGVCREISPFIMTVDQAYQYISNFVNY